MKYNQLLELLETMSLTEKINQLSQLTADFLMNDKDTIISGPAKELGITQKDIENTGSVLGIYSAEKIIKIQKEYMKHQPHHIPLLFMMDVIHGMMTIFPMPLAQGATFEPELAKECAKVSAKEASVSGLHVTFSPMVDLVRDARWGRVMESTGEDSFLNSLFAEAIVKGYQGDNLKDPETIAACVKHFAAYGGAEGGRDYNNVELSEQTLREYYFPAFQAAIQANAAFVMTSFNSLNGIPATVNKWLMNTILREEMKFQGILITDYAAINETISHGVSEDGLEAALKSIECGVEIDMMSGSYAKNLEELVHKNLVKEKTIDQAVLKVLDLKNKLGLFENPFRNADVQKEKEIHLCQEHRDLARKAANHSFVLLKNENVLPINKNEKISFIGPYIDSKSINSSWAVTGNEDVNITLRTAAKQVFSDLSTEYHKGCPILPNDIALTGIKKSFQEKYTKIEQEQMRKQALESARNSDLVIMPMGEHYLQSGEAASRGMIDIPEIQMSLFREIYEINPNIVVVLYTGRPLDLREISAKAKGILLVWLPGTEGSHAIIDTLTGKNNPSGKLPMSFPYMVGQVPVHYDSFITGRPLKNNSNDKFLSKYLDIPNEPLYPFGYGLSYTTFSISEIIVSQETMHENEKIQVSVTVKNTGSVMGEEVVQLYIQDLVASVVRPVKQLKAFKKVKLQAGQEQEISFEINKEMLSFYDAQGNYICEKGEFLVFVGNDSRTRNQKIFEYLG